MGSPDFRMIDFIRKIERFSEVCFIIFLHLRASERCEMSESDEYWISFRSWPQCVMTMRGRIPWKRQLHRLGHPHQPRDPPLRLPFSRTFPMLPTIPPNWPFSIRKRWNICRFRTTGELILTYISVYPIDSQVHRRLRQTGRSVHIQEGGSEFESLLSIDERSNEENSERIGEYAECPSPQCIQWNIRMRWWRKMRYYQGETFFLIFDMSTPCKKLLYWS